MNYAHSLEQKAIKQKIYHMKLKLPLLQFALLITFWIGGASIVQATTTNDDEEEAEPTQLLSGVATGCDNLFFGVIENGTNNISLIINEECETKLPADITINSTATDGNGTTYYITGINNLQNCTTLKSITLPASITTIDEQAFLACTNLKTVTINGNITIGNYAFQQCNNIERVIINGSTITCTNSFVDCNNQITIDMPNATTINKNAFANCSNIQTINIPKATTIEEYAFLQCTSLKTINLENVTSIGNFAFYGCVNLNQELKFNENLTKIGEAAFDSTSIVGNLVIPGSVKKIGRCAFHRCKKLTGTLTLKEGIEEIGNGAFQKTTLKGNIKLPQSLKKIEANAFLFSTLGEGEDLIIPKNVTYIGGQAFLKDENTNQKEWRSISFAEGSAAEEFGVLEDAVDGNKKKTKISGQIFGGVSTYIDLTKCTKLKTTNPYGYFFERNKTYSKTEKEESIKKPVFYGVHPWVLIYLPKHIQVTEQGEQSYPVNFVSNGKCKDLRVYERHGFKAIYPFTAETATYVDCDDAKQFTDLKKAYNIHEPRKFWGSKCYTLCLPYPVKVKRDGFTDAKAYHLRKQFWGKNGEREIYQFVSFDDNDTIPANTPFLLYGVNSKEKLPLLQCMQNVEVPITPDIKDKSELKEDLRYYGTTLPISFSKIKDEYSKNNQEVYLLNYQDKTWYPVRNNENAKIPPFRCFIQTGNQQATAKFAVLMENINEKETLHINKQVLNNIKNNIHTFYTIDGKAMGNNFDCLPKRAIYIINGRKIYKF